MIELCDRSPTPPLPPPSQYQPAWRTASIRDPRLVSPALIEEEPTADVSFLMDTAGSGFADGSMVVDSDEPDAVGSKRTTTMV